MYEVELEAKQKVRCLLVFPPSVQQRELESLVQTLDMEVADIVTLPEKNPSASIARFGIGSGKAQEIAELAQAQEADCIIFDTELVPVRRPKDADGNSLMENPTPTIAWFSGGKPQEGTCRHHKKNNFTNYRHPL